ncbi:hypothetical protein [Streptomyces sp. ERV7]|uniref:hypothetical protein n=1 Tax=Streptomyces sp. ERV7 TaxID=1322334 RepID=UPI001F4874A8|nr:hypothetical protein [Streptomyces sp. ERV7]
MGTASASGLPPDPSPSKAPVSYSVAGPENAAASGSRPASGSSPSAGTGYKYGGYWRVVTPDVVLRNTVTDPDGGTVNLTFEVWTTDASGKPKDKVKLTDKNPYGVEVSPYVASGKTAQVPVERGRLKPGVTYTFHTNAYDGSLYETEWSPWANFRIEPYLSFPAPQASSTIDPVAQKVIEFTRTDPGPALPTLRKDGTTFKAPTRKRTCGAPDAQGHKLCIELNPPSKTAQTPPRASAPAGLDVDQVDWCFAKPSGKNYMNRTEACLKNIGGGTLIFTDTDPDKPALGTATFSIEQRLKTYPKKADSGSDLAEFDQQVKLVPTHIDPALKGVRMRWNAGTVCTNCATTNIRWADSTDTPIGDAYWKVATDGIYGDRWGTIQTRWSGTGKETIDLGWSITATVDAGGNPATADFGSSGIHAVRELAPRCDDIPTGIKPGCVLPYFSPTYTVDTNLYPAAGAYYWLMQQKMPYHDGSVRWDSLLSYLGPDTTVKNPKTGQPWTKNDSRGVVCPDNWAKHPADASLGTLSCDEYAMATTHESGGFPARNQVTSGDQCAQLFADTMGDGSNFGLWADTRTATNGPSGKEPCGRASIPDRQNSGAFHDFPAPTWRMLDGDTFFVSNPGFEHCTSVHTTCAWRKVG